MNKYSGDSNQEAFVLDVLDYKRDGFYVELGAFHSSEGSNTYALEKSFGWQGVSFELVDERREELQDFISQGSLKDHAEYQKLCGVIQGLDFAKLCIEDLAKRLEIDADE